MQGPVTVGLLARPSEQLEKAFDLMHHNENLINRKTIRDQRRGCDENFFDYNKNVKSFHRLSMDSTANINCSIASPFSITIFLSHDLSTGEMASTEKIFALQMDFSFVEMFIYRECE